MKVRAYWEFDVDTADFDEEFVNVKELAKDLTKRELQSQLDNGDISPEDFEYQLIEE